MPKIEPLTRARRIVALVVLLLCFLASIGFAQLLVQRSAAKHLLLSIQQDRAATRHSSITVKIPDILPEVASDDPRIITSRRGLIDGQPRVLEVYFFSGTEKARSPLEAARDLFEEIVGSAPTHAGATTLAGLPAVELRNFPSSEDLPETETLRFDILRWAFVGNRIVAIHYSGLHPITDADEELFSQVCRHGVAIRTR